MVVSPSCHVEWNLLQAALLHGSFSKVPSRMVFSPICLVAWQFLQVASLYGSFYKLPCWMEFPSSCLIAWFFQVCLWQLPGSSSKARQRSLVSWSQTQLEQQQQQQTAPTLS
jgi:hypothetical protein